MLSQVGLKNDYEGHDNIHYGNLYAYVSSTCISLAAATQLPGHVDKFYNNTCIIGGVREKDDDDDDDEEEEEESGGTCVVRIVCYAHIYELNGLFRFEIIQTSNTYGNLGDTCNVPDPQLPYLENNHLFTRYGNTTICGMSLASWQEKHGLDKNSTIDVLPEDDIVIDLAKSILGL